MLEILKSLRKSGKVIELENLLLELVKATEAESAMDGMGVAPAYYSELAILYRKQKEYSKEISILERFAKQKHARGVMPAKLLERLEKAKELAATQETTFGLKCTQPKSLTKKPFFIRKS